MKLLLVSIILCSLSAIAQDTTKKSSGSGDISMFVMMPEGEAARPLFWGTYTFENHMFLDIRYNFDWHSTTAVGCGYVIKCGKQWITPELGVLFGEYNSISPVIIAGGDIGAINWFIFNQLSMGITGDDPDFIYQYTQTLTSIAPSKLKAGIAVQAYYEDENIFTDGSTTVHTLFVDIGPVLTYTAHNIYFKPWITIDPWHDWKQKAIVGIGYTF